MSKVSPLFDSGIFAARGGAGSRQHASSPGTPLAKSTADAIRRSVEKVAQTKEAGTVAPVVSQPLTEKELKVADSYGQEPAYLTQYTDPQFAGTWKLMPPQLEVLDLMSEAGLKRFNKLLEMAEPVTAPQVLLQRNIISGIGASGAVATALVTVTRIMYKRDATVKTLAEELAEGSNSTDNQS